jgi:predicted small secreted protein
MSVSPKEVSDHILMHEILGIGATVSDGALTIINGYPVYNDPTRANKTLTIARNTFSAGKSGKVKNAYIFTEDGVNTQKTGIRMARKGTITMISVENSKSNTFTLRVRKNGSVTNLASVAIVAGIGAHDVAVDLNFNQGDLLQLYIDGTANDPHAWIEVAWRVT